MASPGREQPLARITYLDEAATVAAITADTTQRRGMAWALAGLGLSVILSSGCHAVIVSHELKATELKTFEELPAVLALGLVLLSRGAILFACLWFGIRLLSIAERLLLPSWLSYRPENAELVRTLTGRDVEPVKKLAELAKVLRALLPESLLKAPKKDDD